MNSFTLVAIATVDDLYEKFRPPIIMTLYQTPEVIKLFMLNSTEHKTYHAHDINIKMPTIVGILTFISMINTTCSRLKVRKVIIFQQFNFYEQLKFRAQGLA